MQIYESKFFNLAKNLQKSPIKIKYINQFLKKKTTPFTMVYVL